MAQLKYTIRTNYLLLVACVIALSCGQSVRGVQQSYLVSKVVFPGTPPLQNAGHANIYHSDTVFTIYLEVKNGYIPAWVVAKQNDRLFSVITSAIDGDSIQLGQSVNNTPAYIAITKKGNRLLQLQLKEKAPSANNGSSIHYANTIIVYTSSESSKKTIVDINKEIELMPERRP